MQIWYTLSLKKFIIVYLKFKFNWVSYILSHNPDTEESRVRKC
jgi:hypothetical protein